LMWFMSAEATMDNAKSFAGIVLDNLTA